MTKTISASSGEIISLNQNFRSRPGIVNLANLIAKPLEKTLFDKDAIQTNNTEIDLIAARENSKSAAVTKLMCKSNDKATVAEQRRSEADMIAKYILQLTANSEVNFGDITCLFQAITASDIYEQSFRKHGIPYRTLGSRNLLEQIEVSDLLAALEFSANSENNHALLTLARSPLIGLSDDECTLLAGTDGKQFRNNIFHHQKSGRIGFDSG